MKKTLQPLRQFLENYSPELSTIGWVLLVLVFFAVGLAKLPRPAHERALVRLQLEEDRTALLERIAVSLEKITEAAQAPEIPRPAQKKGPYSVR